LVGELQPTWTRERLAELQKAHPDVAIIREWLEAEVEPTRDRVMPCSTEVKAYVSQWKLLIVDDGVVQGKFEKPTLGVLFKQLVVPRSMRAELLELIHAVAACHQGVRKTINQVQRRAYWFS